jgi:hypothetical protein
MNVSYSWNGAVISGTMGRRTHKISAFNPMDILQWESDENLDIFNDVANHPGEGISQRHAGRNTTVGDRDVGGGATIGLISGSTEYFQYKNFKIERDNPQKNRLWCNPAAANGRF